MKSLAPVLVAAALALAVAGCDSPIICDSDAGVLRTISLGPGMDCWRGPVSVPRRHSLQCGPLPADFVGSRVVLEGRAGQNWRLDLDRTDGTSPMCVATLDDTCRCTGGQCTASAAERVLVVDLGIVETDSMEVVLPAGTYDVTFCSRPMT